VNIEWEKLAIRVLFLIIQWTLADAISADRLYPKTERS